MPLPRRAYKPSLSQTIPHFGSLRDLQVWFTLIDHADVDTGTTWVSQTTIAKHLGMRRPHVSRSIQNLIASHLLLDLGTHPSGTHILKPICSDGDTPLWGNDLPPERARHAGGCTTSGTQSVSDSDLCTTSGTPPQGHVRFRDQLYELRQYPDKPDELFRDGTYDVTATRLYHSSMKPNARAGAI